MLFFALSGNYSYCALYINYFQKYLRYSSNNLLTPENCGHIPEPFPGSDFGYHGGSDIWVMKVRDNGEYISQIALESGYIGKCYGGTDFDQKLIQQKR